jgi:hypothetical protein
MLVTHPLFQLELPDGWHWQGEDDGGGAIAPDARGVLYITAQRVADKAQLPSLTRMLAGWLTQHVRPVATDELVSASFPGARGYAWQYTEEYVDKPKHAFRVWVAGNEAAWAFLNFNVPVAKEPEGRPDVDRIIASFTLVS